MTKGNTPDFDVYINHFNAHGSLVIRKELNAFLSNDTLRRIELEAKEGVLDHLQPLKETIGRVIANDQKLKEAESAHKLQSDEDICEACQ